MNKQEAIEEIKNIGTLNVNDRVAGQQVDFVVKNQVLDIVSKISDSQKVVVPKFVADWYEEQKENLDEAVWEYIANWDDEPWDDFKRWMSLAYENEAITTLVNMHQCGYEVEKEPRYLVKVKGIDGYYAYLDKELRTSKWIFGTIDNFANHRTHHTRKELEEAGFGWVFDCEGIAIEEVEE